jgi:REP element-mobilizing transposase RayT
MARKLRLLFPHALYHVINRGNYRRDVFETPGSRGAFIRALGETCRRYRWRVHAYVVMRNHFHLALETAEPNLTEGMHWLLGTFANRFNRFRSEHGHLFQGRYQAQLVEDASALGRVVDYIHLNPVRAGLVPPAAVADFPDGSLPVFQQEGCPEWLSAEGILERMGTVRAGLVWPCYLAHLAELAGSPDAQAKLGFPNLSRGWAIGTRGWMRALAKDHAHLALSPGMEAREVRMLREERWHQALAGVLAAAGVADHEIAAGTVGWSKKLEIAADLKREVGAPYGWIARTLKISNAASLRMQVHRRLLQVSA